MATSPGWSPSQATPYNPYAGFDFATSNPRTISANTQATNANAAGNANQYATAVQDYLGNIIQPAAQGQGGYSPSETSQIEMTPQQQQNMVTSSGISSGSATESAADAAQRAANAAGGNPQAVAAYRARAAQQAGQQAGNAQTQAQVAAQQAQAQNVENVGQTRLGQQNQAENYLSNLQGEQNQNAQNASNRQVQGAGIGLNASQTPSTFDQVMGGIGGALSFLDDGSMASIGQPMGYRSRGKTMGTPELTMAGGGDQAGGRMANQYLDNGGMSRQAIVAEKDPEAVVKIPNYMDFGDMPTDDSAFNTPMGAGDGTTSTSTPMGTQGQPSIWDRLKQRAQSMGGGMGGGSPMQQTNPSNVGSSIGRSAGELAGMFLNDGAIITQPTKVGLAPDEAVVPLKYREKAKARPSMAIPLVNQIQKRKMYPGMGNPSAQPAMA